jgi:hypothetical protein
LPESRQTPKLYIRSKFELSLPYDLSVSFYFPQLDVNTFHYVQHINNAMPKNLQELLTESDAIHIIGKKYMNNVITSLGLKSCIMSMDDDELKYLQIDFSFLGYKKESSDLLNVLYAALSNKNTIDHMLTVITGNIHSSGSTITGDVYNPRNEPTYKRLCRHIPEVEIKDEELYLLPEDKHKLLRRLFYNDSVHIFFPGGTKISKF